MRRPEDGRVGDKGAFKLHVRVHAQIMTGDLPHVLIGAIGFASIARPNECAASPERSRRARMGARREPRPARVKWPCKLPLICRTAPGRHGGPRHSGTSERAGPGKRPRPTSTARDSSKLPGTRTTIRPHLLSRCLLSPMTKFAIAC